MQVRKPALDLHLERPFQDQRPAADEAGMALLQRARESWPPPPSPGWRSSPTPIFRPTLPCNWRRRRCWRRGTASSGSLAAACAPTWTSSTGNSRIECSNRAPIAGRQLCRRLRVEGGWYAVLRVPAVRSDEELAPGAAARDGRAGASGTLLQLSGRGLSGAQPDHAGSEFGEGVRRLLAFAGRSSAARQAGS